MQKKTQTEIIDYNGKKVTKKIKVNGQISYSLKGVYIGTDTKTGKRVTASLSAKTLRQLDRKIVEAKIEFEENGSTVKEILKVTTFKELAEEWFSNFIN